MKKKSLSSYTVEELQAELAKRKAKGIPENANWYYMLPEDDNEGMTGPEILLVHKRFWHHSHHIDDRHLDFLDGIAFKLPDGFDEVMDSTFEYTKGNQEEMIRVLQEYGFTEVPPYIFRPDEPGRRRGFAVHCFETEEMEVPRGKKKKQRKRYRLDVVTDTPQIQEWMEKLTDASDELKPTWTNLEAYERWLRLLVENQGWKLLWRRGPYDLLYGCIIEQEVEDSLPPYPEDPFEPGQPALRDKLQELPDD